MKSVVSPSLLVLRFMNANCLLRLYAASLETGKVSDQVAEFFASQGIGKAGRHGGALVDAFFDCFAGDLADFAGGEIAQADRAIVF